MRSQEFQMDKMYFWLQNENSYIKKFNVEWWDQIYFGELSTDLRAGKHQIFVSTIFFDHVTLNFRYYVSLIETKQRPKIKVLCEI